MQPLLAGNTTPSFIDLISWSGSWSGIRFLILEILSSTGSLRAFQAGHQKTSPFSRDSLTLPDRRSQRLKEPLRKRGPIAEPSNTCHIQGNHFSQKSDRRSLNMEIASIKRRMNAERTTHYASMPISSGTTRAPKASAIVSAIVSELLRRSFGVPAELLRRS